MKFANIAQAIAACALLAISSGAIAAEPSTPQVSPRAIRALHSFARCVVQQNPAEARAVLSAYESSPNFENSLLRLLDHNTHCLDHGSLAGNRRLFVARMAEALLALEVGDGELAQRVALDPARPPLQASDESELMSLCIVRSAPNDVAALFGTQPASEAETAAIGVLIPHLGRCLRQGARGEFNRPAIRSMLALAAYRLVRNIPSAS